MIQEYKVSVSYDPYWARQIELLVSAGIPRSIAESAITKTENERAAREAYA